MAELVQTRYIHRRLENLEGQIAEARRRLKVGTPEERLDARGDLEVLERRKATLEQRLGEIESGNVDTMWEKVGARFEQDVAILEDDLKRWMDGLDEQQTVR